MMFNLHPGEFFKDLPGSFSNLQLIKNPWGNNSVKLDKLQQEFYLRVEFSDSKQAVKMISETIDSFDFVIKNEGNPVKIIVDSPIEHRVKLLVVFWFDTHSLKGKRPGTKTQIMLEVMDRLEQAGIRYSG